MCVTQPSSVFSEEMEDFSSPCIGHETNACAACQHGRSTALGVCGCQALKDGCAVMHVPARGRSPDLSRGQALSGLQRSVSPFYTSPCSCLCGKSS